MLNAIDDASRASADPPESNTILVAHLLHTGLSGPPSISIDPNFLAVGMALCGPSHVAAMIGCSARTAHCCALEQGLVQPGSPVYINHINDNGTTTRFWTSTNRDASNLSDDDLDAITFQILQTFPNFG